MAVTVTPFAEELRLKRSLIPDIEMPFPSRSQTILTTSFSTNPVSLLP